MKLTAIVAMAPNRVIGRDGSLPWHISEELKFFKSTTTGHPIVMGRKTYDSIGKPLPKRENLVLTRDPAWHADGVEVIHRPADIRDLPLVSPEIFVIGGAQIYDFFLPQTTELLISHIHEAHEGDTYFPAYEEQFPEVETVLEHPDFTVKRHRRPAGSAPFPFSA